MGTISSVLQWSCTKCNTINPTESLKCYNCGTVRKVFPSPTATLSSHQTTATVTATTAPRQPSTWIHRQQAPPHPAEALPADGESLDRSKTVTRNEYNKHVYKSLLRGCLKRPQRNSQNLPANCVDCEDTRKYIKSSIELYRHFSNPALNRRWICHACETDNNSVTWHCLICDTVSYLAPIYKDAIAGDGPRGQDLAGSLGSGSKAELLPDRSDQNSHHSHHQLHQHQHQHQHHQEEHQQQQHSQKRHLKGSGRSGRFSLFRRTQSLSTAIDKSSSGRSCHICYVNNQSKDIFNLPQSKPQLTGVPPAATCSNSRFAIANDTFCRRKQNNNNKNQNKVVRESCAKKRYNFTITTLSRSSAKEEAKSNSKPLRQQQQQQPKQQQQANAQREPAHA